MRTEHYMISNLSLWRVGLMPPSQWVSMETAGSLKVHSGLPFYMIFHPRWRKSSLQDFSGSGWIILTAFRLNRQSKAFCVCVQENSAKMWPWVCCSSDWQWQWQLTSYIDNPRNRNNIVCITTVLPYGRSGVRIRLRARELLFCKTVQTDWGTHRV
jgi:hypothetical protein